MKNRILFFGFIVFLIFIIWKIYLLDKYFFIYPIEGNTIIRCDGWGNGYFGAKRNGNRKHAGIDLLAGVGTTVLASRSGLVLEAKYHRGMGNYVKILHEDGYISVYGHLSVIEVKDNQFIRQGQIIGSVGKTGNAIYQGIEPHLHFEIRKDNLPQDPLEGYLEENV